MSTPYFTAAQRAIGTASDKMVELQVQALYLGKFVVSGTVKYVAMFDELIEIAVSNGLCLTPRNRAEVEHVIREGFAGRSAGVGHRTTSSGKESAARERSLVVVRAADVRPENYEWVWPGRLALGKHTLFAGEPGTAKSQLMMWVAAVTTASGTLPCDEGDARSGSMIILSAEDGVADTIVPRLMFAGADTSRIHIVRGTRNNDGKGETFNLQADLNLLKKKIDEVGDVCLVGIDPITAYLGRVDSHKNAELRSVLEPITQMAEDARVAVLSITHFNKGLGLPALHRVIGSVAFTAAPRAAFVVVKDPEDKDRRLFLEVKNNLHAPCQGLAFRLEQGLVDNERVLASRIYWESKPITATVEEAIRGSTAQDEPKALRAAAMEILREFSFWW